MLTQIKNILKKNSDNKNTVYKWSVILFSIYCSCVLYLTFFNSLFFIFLLPIFALVLYFLIKSVSLNLTFKYETNTYSKYLFIVIFIIILVGQLIFFGAYYPGGFNLDAYGQWDQVHGIMQLNNWHPILTTAIYWLLTRIVDKLSFCILVQLILFSLSLSLLFQELHRLGVSRKILYLASLFITLNPAIGMNNVCLYKDAYYTIVMILIIKCSIHIYFTDGEYLKKRTSQLIITILLIALQLIRHNGIFFIFPFLALLLIFYKKELISILKIGIVFSLSIILIEGPIFNLLKVEQHSNVIGESVGIPMAIMANALINDEQNIPEDVKEFLVNIAPVAEWKEHYYVGEWDSCKWEFGGTELFKDESLSHILELTLKTVISCPESTYESLRENTRVAWQIIGYSYWNTFIYIEENDYGIEFNKNELLSNVSNVLLKISNTEIGSILTWNVGTTILLMGIEIVYITKKKNNKKLLFIVPILFYNFLTMLLLCGPSHRYFYFNTVLIIPIMLLVCINGSVKKEYHSRI